MREWKAAQCVAVVMLILLAVAPRIAEAQSAIAGTVVDASGAVLPGVTVEASSPALIEQTRAVVTDASGNYRVIDLRPGVYTVTFSLPGFNMVTREGIELPASFTATVNAELRVGDIVESITVSAASPTVDIQSATSQRQFQRELLDATPVSSRSPQAFAGLTPGASGQGIGTIPGGVFDLHMGIHGSPASEAVYSIDGMNTASAQVLGGGGNVFRISQSYVAEINVVSGGGTAEQPLGGLVTDVIPKEGGNVFSGGGYFEYSNENLTFDNLTDELLAQGFTADSLSNLERLWDVSAYVGGPILTNKVWFFTSFREAGSVQGRAGIYDNLTPLGWAYTPDFSRPAVAKLTQHSKNARVTWQVTPRNKVSLFADLAPQVAWQRGYTNTSPISPEATNYSPYQPNTFFTASWKSPASNSLLFEANVVRIETDFEQRRQTPDTCQCSAPAVGHDVVSTIETTTGTMFRAGSRAGGLDNYGHFAPTSYDYKGSVSYVTGSHSFKAGAALRRGSMWFTQEPNLGLAYSLRAGVPIFLTQYATPIDYENRINADLGVFVQDQWTMRRLTINGGLRFDYIDLTSDERDLPAGPWVPARSFEAVRLARWKDFSPRLGVVYDLLGTGKTALKASLGRYVIGQGAGSLGINNNNPIVRSVLDVTRTWNDVNRDYVPDCDLTNPLANGECGQISNLNFGQANPNATVYDDELVNGLRGYNWETTVQVQHEIAPRMSVSVGYYRRNFGNFTVNDNQFVGPGDFDEYCITAPVDPMLPGGGGNQICGLYDVVPALFGRNQTVVRSAHHYGKQTQIYDGIDITENIRLSNGATISGGVSIGRTKTSACFVVDSPGQMRFCDVVPPFQPNVSVMGFYPLPWGFVTSATYRDYPGPQITASYRATNAEIRPSLGRDLSSGPNGTVNIPLVEPGTMYGDRERQIDFRIAKRVQIDPRTRLNVSVDIFNLFNTASVSRLNTTYGPSWQRPTQLQQGRYVKFGAQLDF